MKRDSAIRILRDYGIVVVLTILVSYFIKAVAFEVFRISHTSMATSLIPGDNVFIEKFGFSGVTQSNWKEILDIGDIVLFEEMRGSKRFFLRRVLGLPGDKIQLLEGRVIRNGKSLVIVQKENNCATESFNSRRWEVCYIAPLLKDMAEFTVGSSEIFVLPDQRTIEETDATVFGVVPPPVLAQLDEIEGKATRIIFSFEKKEEVKSNDVSKKKSKTIGAQLLQFPAVRWERVGKEVD